MSQKVHEERRTRMRKFRENAVTFYAESHAKTMLPLLPLTTLRIRFLALKYM